MHVLDEWLLTPERVAVHVPTAAAVVGDLHLGYGEARRAGGDAVPLPGVEQTTHRLRSVLVRHHVRRLIVAGDLFEQRWSAACVSQLLGFLAEEGIKRVEIVPGNHDRACPDAIEGVVIAQHSLAVGRWRVLHGHQGIRAARTVRGHFHPRLAWRGLSAPCFLVSERDIVLPAFSEDAAGVNVLRNRRWYGHRCHAIIGDTVLDFGEVAALTRSHRLMK